MSRLSAYYYLACYPPESTRRHIGPRRKRPGLLDNGDRGVLLILALVAVPTAVVAALAVYLAS